MPLKDLLVVTDATPGAAARIDVAAQIAARFDAHLTALYVAGHAALPAYVEAELPDEVRSQHRRLADEKALKVRAVFDEHMRRHGITDHSEFRYVRGEPTDVAAVHGRYADLVVVGQVDPKRDRDVPVVLPQDLLFECGRPLLVVPYAGTFPTVGRNVLLGWNASREAARAAGDALPLLGAAERVLVLSVDPRPGMTGLGDEPGADIAKHLAHHDCKVEVAHAASDHIDPGDAMLNTIADQSIDLVVMGAYGRSRIRELVLGGMTRHMLQHMTVPVLMSH